MYYKEYSPSPLLKNFVQCYFLCEGDTATFTEDKVFATGFIEIMFNLGESSQQIKDGDSISQPDVQLWGQTIKPFTFSSSGKHSMLGIRFFPHTAACFLNEPISRFNNQVIDFGAIEGNAAILLHALLKEAKSINRQVELVEEFLIKKLSRASQKLYKLKLVNSIIHDLQQDDFFENINSVAARSGISSRYLQTIFVNYSGLSPNLYSKISRFQKSIHLVSGNNLPLTTVAYKCGYYDQSHFIKDFKFFTGSTPSCFSPEISTDLSAALYN